MPKTKYYTDVQNDDFFAGKTYDKIVVDQNFDYRRKSFGKRVFDFVLYYVFAKPILGFVLFVAKRTKIVGRENLKKVRKKGCMLVCNHSNILDAYLGGAGLLALRKNYIICSSNSVKIPVVGGLILALGGLPVPETIGASKRFFAHTRGLLESGGVISVFPEAHLWPYATFVRPFNKTCFRIAASAKACVVPVAVTYRQSKFFKNGRPRAVVFVGEPIFFDRNSSREANAEKFFEKSLEFIRSKVEKSDNYCYINYIEQKKG